MVSSLNLLLRTYHFIVTHMHLYIIISPTAKNPESVIRFGSVEQKGKDC